MLRVKEVNDFSEFDNLKDSWNQILQKCRDNDVFSTWEWLGCWWKHFGKKRDLKLLIAQKNGETIGFAPLMLSEYSFLNLAKLHKIEFVGSPNSDYNNFILFKQESDCLKLFLRHLMGLSEWDLLELRDIRERSASANALQMVCDNQISNLTLNVGTLCPYINLPNSVDVFEHHLSRNMRKNLRKRMRKLGENYKVEFKTQHDFDSIKKAMEIFFKLHLKRWRSEGRRPGAFASEAFRTFHLDLAEVLNKKGWLALHFLTLNDEPSAVVYSFDYNQKKYGYQAGFNPEFGSYGVASLLKMHVVEYCIKKGLREYDLTRDFEPYKADWATAARKNLVARMVYKGFFARFYNWSTQNRFSRLLTRKLGAHLAIGIAND
jgi:CelD/BcsL family acetyltransferase involved in cellulose biosynthesis